MTINVLFITDDLNYTHTNWLVEHYAEWWEIDLCDVIYSDYAVTMIDYGIKMPVWFFSNNQKIMYLTESGVTEITNPDNVLNTLVQLCLDIGHHPCVINKCVVKAIKNDKSDI